MLFPVEITFRGVSQSDAVEAVVRQRASRLERFCDRIRRCHVTIDMPHQHHSRGNHFAVHVEVETPHGKVIVTRDPTSDDSHKDFQSVVRDAFHAVTRQLDEDAQRQRGEQRPQQQRQRSGRITRLFPGSGYGYLATKEGGEEVYFNENSVLDAAFERLNLCSEVSFTLAPEGIAEGVAEGARAASVRLLRS